jgi:hypothetical protein
MTSCEVYGAPEGHCSFCFTFKNKKIPKQILQWLGVFFCSTIEGGTPLYRLGSGVERMACGTGDLMDCADG